MQDTPSPNRTLDLASALEVGPAGNKTSGDNVSNGGSKKSVMTIAFQFAFEMHLQDSVAAMARQYVRSIIASVQRVALALSPSNFGSHAGLRPPPGSPEAQTLARWICQSYRLVINSPIMHPYIYNRRSTCYFCLAVEYALYPNTVFIDSLISSFSKIK